MARYDYGYRRDGGYWRGDWSAPSPPEMRGGYGRGHSGDRPWTGGFRDGYQGGTGGIPTEGYRDAAGTSRGARDDWWLGGHHPGRYDEAYDRAFREFDERHHPRYSPVGGTYHAMGGSYQYRRPPRPLRDDMWFSDWTRWF
jgi:hypothetical protein